MRYVKPGVEEHAPGDCRMVQRPQSSPQELLAAQLVQRLEGVNRLGFRLQGLGPVLAALPSRLGVNRALDQATRALLSVHDCLLQDVQALRPNDLWHYDHALICIRHELAACSRRISIELVCAALVLSFFEVCKTPLIQT